MESFKIFDYFNKDKTQLYLKNNEISFKYMLKLNKIGINYIKNISKVKGYFLYLSTSKMIQDKKEILNLQSKKPSKEKFPTDEMLLLPFKKTLEKQMHLNEWNKDFSLLEG